MSLLLVVCSLPFNSRIFQYFPKATLAIVSRIENYFEDIEPVWQLTPVKPGTQWHWVRVDKVRTGPAIQARRTGAFIQVWTQYMQ